MKTPRLCFFVVGLAVVTAGWQAHSQTKDNHPPKPSQTPKLVITCVITSNVKRLVEFYEPILAVKATWTGEDDAEFSTGEGVLAVFSAEAQEKYIPGSAKAAKNESVVLQFRVADVDQEYRRLQSPVKLGQATYDTALGNPFNLLS